MSKYITIFFILLSFSSKSQIIRANAYYTNIGPKVDTLLLDSFPGASAAYSMRKLRTSYSGSCIRVRRSSDNAEQNIGFVNNYIDTTTLKTFCSGTNGFVTTWYDQSDSAKNATQTSASLQPRVILSGALQYFNNRPAVNFIAASLTHLLYNPIFITSSVMSSFVAANNTNAAGIRTIIGATSASAPVLRFSGTTHQVVRQAVINLQTGVAASGNVIVSVLTDANNVRTRVNGVSTNTVVTVGFTNNPNWLGGQNFGGVYFNGTMGEVVIYANDRSSNRTSIENNINRNWLIY